MTASKLLDSNRIGCLRITEDRGRAMMTTTSTTEKMHPAYTDGRREFLAAWATRRLTAALPYAMLALLGINPEDPVASSAMPVLAVLFVVACVVQHQLHKRAWWWVPPHAPAGPEPAGFFWAHAALDVVLPITTACLVLTFTQNAVLPELVAIFFAIGAGHAAAASFREMSHRDRIAQAAQVAALALSTVRLDAPYVVSVVLIAVASGSMRILVREMLGTYTVRGPRIEGGPNADH
jgi:hypothetical protein